MSLLIYLRPKIKSLTQVCNILESVFSKRKKLIKESEKKYL